MLIFLAIYVLKEENPDLIKKIKKFINIWNFGLVMTVAMFLMKGIANTLGANYSKAIASAISGLSGIGHTVLAVGLVMSCLMIVKAKYKE